MRPRPRFRRRASRTWLASILAGLAAAGIAARHIPAAGGSVPPPPPGTLQSLASGKCADLPAGQSGDGTQAVQYDCHGGPNQQWTIESLGDAGVLIVSRMTGKCLGPEPGSPRSGGHVVEASCDGSLGQLWSLRDDGNGYVFQTIASRLCLDVMGSSRANGAKLITWKCTGASNQTWRYGSPIAP